MPKAEPPRVAVHRGRAGRARGRAVREGVRPSGRGVRPRRHRRARPPLGPRPAVHAVRHERHAARPARRCSREKPSTRLARGRRPPHRPRVPRRVPRPARASPKQLLESLHLETAVLHVGRATSAGKRRSACSCATAKGQERIDTADVVLDCTGTYAHPELARRRRHPGGRRTRRAAAHRQRTGRHPGRAEEPLRGPEHRARRRRLLRRDDDLRSSRRSRRSTPRRGCSG